MSRRTVFSGSWLFILIAACAGSGTQYPGQGTQRLGDPDFILREEIDESNARSAYELVRNVRPQWLQTRGISTLRQAAGQDGIRVYIDNARLQDVNSMRNVTLASVRYLQFFTAPEATQRWGGGHMHGAILISTRGL